MLKDPQNGRAQNPSNTFTFWFESLYKSLKVSYHSFHKVNMSHGRNTRKIPDQVFQYPIIPDWLFIWCKYPYPIHTRTDPKYFFQYPIHTRPEVEKPYPSAPAGMALGDHPALSFVCYQLTKDKTKMSEPVELSNQPEHGTDLSFFWCVCFLQPVSSAHSGRPNIWVMFWRRLVRRHGSAQTAVAVRVARLQSKNRWQILGHDQHQINTKSPRQAKFVFLTPCWWRKIQCLPTERRFGIFQFGISLFSQLCFLTPHSLGRRWRLLHSPQSAQMHFGPHCNAFQCSELHCSALQPVLWSAQQLPSRYSIDNCSESHAVMCEKNTVCIMNCTAVH